jgi:hypothetical protein
VHAQAPGQALGQDADSAEVTRNGSMPISISRMGVDAALLVCRVDSTMWPVSAASMAMTAVSLSRISPTRTMSGSERRMAFRATRS